MHQLTLVKCEIHGSRIVRRGSPISLSLKEAIDMLAPSRDQSAKANVMRAKIGNYIGVRKLDRGIRNFLLVNRTSDGDVGWLFEKNPNLMSTISEIYLVDEVTIVRNAVDL